MTLSQEDSELREHIENILDNKPVEVAVNALMLLIKARDEARNIAIVYKIANPEFVYELMNAPTNGEAVRMIIATLTPSSKQKEE